MEDKELAYWLADKIPACGDYAKQAAQVLRTQADEVERLRAILEEIAHAAYASPEVLRHVAREALPVPNC